MLISDQSWWNTHVCGLIKNQSTWQSTTRISQIYSISCIHLNETQGSRMEYTLIPSPWIASLLMRQCYEFSLHCTLSPTDHHFLCWNSHMMIFSDSYLHKIYSLMQKNIQNLVCILKEIKIIIICSQETLSTSLLDFSGLGTCISD